MRSSEHEISVLEENNISRPTNEEQITVAQSPVQALPENLSSQYSLPSTSAVRPITITDIGRVRSMPNLGHRGRTDVRHSNIDIPPLSPYDIFEPESGSYSIEPSRSVVMELIQTQSTAGKDIYDQIVSDAVEILQQSVITLPSVASYCCRICQLGDESEYLISPCNCRGTLAYIHYSCLTKWLNQSGRNSCELCLFRYNTIESRRYSFRQSCCIWIRHPRNRQHVQSILLISGLFTLFIFGLVLMVLLGMQYFSVEGKKLGISTYWISGAVCISLMFVLLVYIFTLYLLFREQLLAWYRWWHRCVNVRILIDPVTLNTRRPQPTETDESDKLSNSSSNSIETNGIVSLELAPIA